MPRHVICANCGRRVGRKRVPAECPFCGGRTFVRMDPRERSRDLPWWVREQLREEAG